VRAAPDALLAALAPGGRIGLSTGGADDDRWTGAIGEELAARALARDGLVVLGRNVEAREGELDVVARDGDTVVVVEVKCGRASGVSDPAWRPVHRVRTGGVAARGVAAARIAARVGATASRVDVVEVRLDGRARFRLERFGDVGAARPFPWERTAADGPGRRLPP